VEQALARSAEIDATAITVDLAAAGSSQAPPARGRSGRSGAPCVAAPGVVAVENELVAWLPSSTQLRR
jgi:hypothetical protein